MLHFSNVVCSNLHVSGLASARNASFGVSLADFPKSISVVRGRFEYHAVSVRLQGVSTSLKRYARRVFQVSTTESKSQGASYAALLNHIGDSNNNSSGSDYTFLRVGMRCECPTCSSRYFVLLYQDLLFHCLKPSSRITTCTFCFLIIKPGLATGHENVLLEE